MRGKCRVACAIGFVLGFAASAAAKESEASTSVLVTPTQGSPSVPAERRKLVVEALAHALRARGYTPSVDDASLGHALVVCPTPECVERTLKVAGVAVAVVPAIWVRDGAAEELTLTLVPARGRNFNVSGPLGEDISVTTGALVDALLEARASSAPSMLEPLPGVLDASVPVETRRPKRPHAWLAGPVVLIAGGTAAFLAIGIGAATKRDDEQLDTSAVAVWSAVGAGAIAGGTAWWVVGARRRRHLDPARQARGRLAVHPTGIDLRLRF